jgi:hypothetical protein
MEEKEAEKPRGDRSRLLTRLGLIGYATGYPPHSVGVRFPSGPPKCGSGEMAAAPALGAGGAPLTRHTLHAGSIPAYRTVQRPQCTPLGAPLVKIFLSFHYFLLDIRLRYV